jgi:hypothetical protein
MSARFLPFPPIVGIFPHGRYRGLVGTLVAWRNGGRVLVRFDHDGKVREVWRRDMKLFDWQRPQYRRLAVKPRQSPPPITRHDDGGMNPMAA